MKKDTQGFGAYLEEKKSIGFSLHHPLINRQSFYRDIKRSGDLDVFCRKYFNNTLAGIFTNALHLGFGSAGWQLAKNYSEGLSFIMVSLRTGFLASTFYNLSNLILSLDPLKGKLIKLVSKFLPVSLADGLWQFVYDRTDNPVHHWFMYLAVSFIFLSTYAIQSGGLKLLLEKIQKDLKDLIPEVNLSTLLLLTWGYWGFAHLYPYLPSFFDNIPAAFLSVFIPTLAHGLVVDVPMAVANNVSLKKYYHEFSMDSDQCKYIEQEADEVYQPLYDDSSRRPRVPKCVVFSQFLKDCFCFWNKSNRGRFEEKFAPRPVTINS